MRLDDFKKKLLKNPEFSNEYKRYDLTFEIAQMLIEARVIKGITQARLAEMIETKQSSIARAESGNSLPSLSFLQKVAKALKTDLYVKFAFMDNISVRSVAHSASSYNEVFLGTTEKFYQHKSKVNKSIDTKDKVFNYD